MNPVSNQIEKASSSDNNGETSQSQIDPKFFKAAVEGNLGPFKDMESQDIERLLTAKTKNTILHINIISQERGYPSTEFASEILKKCPSLLRKVNAKGDTPLHVAAKFGRPDIVRVLVKEAQSAQPENEDLESELGAAREMIRKTNNEKNTALHEAATCPKSVDVVKILTQEDPDYLYSANNNGKTPLYRAAEYDVSDMVLALLENSTSVSHEGPNGETALHTAAMRSYVGDAAFPKLLEKKKHLIKETDQWGWTPIHYAAYHGNYWTVNLLLETDESAPYIADKDRKMTALHLAADQGHAKIVEAIISKNPECCELVDNNGWNFLHYAMVSFHVGQLRNLLENNRLVRSLIDEGDAKGNTPLHVLAAIGPNEFHYVMLRNAQANYDAVNKQNVSVQHILDYGYPELKKEIQDLSKDVGRGQYSKGVICIREPEDLAVQKYGWTPIHYAAYHGNYRTVYLLLETDQSGRYIADKDRKMTALHLAAGQGHARTVEAFIGKYPACVMLVDNKGWNFVHYAMVSFGVKELRNLLENDRVAMILINEGDAMGNTPLHVLAAVRPNEFRYVMKRITHANYDAVNKQNRSVTDTLYFGYPELKEEIQKLSRDVGRGQYSNGVICIREPEDLAVQNYVTEENYKDMRASHLIVAALIATVAFAAAFTIPGGYRSDNGTAILRRNTAFQAFIVADSIAMLFSLCAVFTHFLMSPLIEVTKDFSLELFNTSFWFTLLSMGAMVIAFATGTYAMLVPSLGLAIITCLIGLSFFLLVIWITRLSFKEVDKSN